MTALLKALGKTLNTVVGVAIPSIGITRNNPIEATVMVTGCELRCPREGQRLMVISVIESKGTTRSRDGMLELPEVETVIASRGPTILDARHPSEVTGDELDDEGAIWSGFTISGGNTVTSLSLLFGLAEFDAYSSNRENYLKSLSEEDLKSIPALTVQEAGIATVVPYCGCIDETASAEEIEEIVVDVINKAPQPAFQPIIEISLTGATQVPRAFQASDPEDDPLWVYVKMEMLSSEGLQVAVNQVTGAATFRTHELSDEMREILLQRRQRRVEVYLYDLKPDAVVVAGTEPTEEQYHNKIGPVAVTLRFTASKPPEAIDVHEYLDAEALRAQGCRIKALFRAYDDDPEGLIHGHRVWFELDLEKTADELQHVASDLYPICTAKGICEGRAFFTTRDAASCLSQSFEALPPVGDYEIGFTVYEANAQGQALFSDTGTYTLTIVSTPPVAQDDNFILRSNAAGDSRSIVCAVLANDRDPDGGVLLAIEIVEAPLHGAAVINDDLTITYTSDEGHGGEDAFTYRVSDVTKTERKDTDWSNEAAVAVKTVTPPAALDMTVRGHPNPETVSEEYAGPWVLSFDAQNPLLLTAVDLDAVSVKDYEFRVGISPENSPGVTFVSIGNDYTPGGLICKDLGCTYDANVNRISFTAPASINGPKSLLPPIFGWSIMRFSFTIIDPDGQESAPGILTVMAGNSPPQGESIQLRTISFRFGEPMIRALEPAWYEAGCLSFTDPDGDPLTFSISRPPRKGRAGLSNTRLDPGVYAVTIMYEIDRDEALLDHTDEEPFVDHLTVEAKDPFGATAETLVEITVDVINSNPVCVDDEVTTPMETAIEFDVLLNDSDVDGDELSVVVVGSAGNGVASSVSDNTIRYVPDNGFYGDDTFTYTAEDEYGGSGEATVTVHVVDTEPPVFVKGPGDVGPLVNTAGLCSAVGKWTEPEIGDDVTDNIGILSLVCTHTSGDAFPVGVTTVTYTATDLSGNTTDYAFTVTVIDDELPVIAGMPSDICIEVPAGVTEMAVSWIEPTASDNCGIASLVGSHVPGSLFPLGKTSVGYVAEDIHGNIAPANFGITVAEAWQLACTDKYAATSNPSGTKVSFADPVTGGCGVSVTFDPASGSFFDVGDTEVMCEVTDGTRTETCTFTVTVEFVNHDPIAVADVVEMDDFEISTEIEVLANDSDADDDELTVIDVSTSSPCGEVWIDPDGQSVWFIGMYCQPYLGGTVTFSYTVSDGNGGEDAATVRIQLPESGTMPEVAEPPGDKR